MTGLPNPSRAVELKYRCLQQLLRPVVRFSLRHSMKVQDMLECAKACFLQIAEEEMIARSETVSISRLSVATGVHRRDVARLQGEEITERKPNNLVSKVIGQWQEDIRFNTKDGKPRTLTVEGEDSEFSELVRSVSQDMNPYTVLYELERTEAVVRNSDTVVLTADVFVPKGDAEENLKILVRDTEGLMSAVEENVSSQPEIPNLHIRTEYDNVSPAHAVEIRRWLLEEGSKFHARARKYISNFDRDISPEQLKDTGEALRVSISSFSQVVDEETQKI